MPIRIRSKSPQAYWSHGTFAKSSNLAQSLIHSDSAAKQILLHVDSSRDGPNKFILRDGEFMLVIDLMYADVGSG
jgi:hypothetical protein